MSDGYIIQSDEGGIGIATWNKSYWTLSVYEPRVEQRPAPGASYRKDEGGEC